MAVTPFSSLLPSSIVLSNWYIGVEFVSGPIYNNFLCALYTRCRPQKDEAEVQSRPAGVY